MTNHRIDLTRPVLRVEAFDNLTAAELRQRANECFERAEGAGQNPMAMSYLLQAQFFLSEIYRREHERERSSDSRIAARDFWMELGVIVLIVLEIIIALWGGYEQDKILRQMNGNIAATASESTVQSKRLGSLTEEQKKSLDSLTQMNAQLQTSVAKTTNMATAMQKQLRILEDEQAARLAELAKKPRLELYVENVPLASITGINFTAREVTETKLTFDVVLTNSGDATATKGMLRVIAFAKDVSISSSIASQPVYETEKDSPQHVMLIPFDYIRPKVRIPMSVTFSYPVGQQPFSVYFNVDADELPTATPLGSMIARPLKP